jgi:hypothetical protein
MRIIEPSGIYSAETVSPFSLGQQRGVAACTNQLELAPPAGSPLHRYFPFGSCLPAMERRGAPGRAEPGDGILQYAPRLRIDIRGDSARRVPRGAAFVGGGLILSGSLIAIWPELRTAAGKR